eukprot:scaffold79037_cov19-Tisochrysis_lutea.AAC.3
MSALPGGIDPQNTYDLHPDHSAAELCHFAQHPKSPPTHPCAVQPRAKKGNEHGSREAAITVIGAGLAQTDGRTHGSNTCSCDAQFLDLMCASGSLSANAPPPTRGYQMLLCALKANRNQFLLVSICDKTPDLKLAAQ